jgi:hypothetical protein
VNCAHSASTGWVFDCSPLLQMAASRDLTGGYVAHATGRSVPTASFRRSGFKWRSRPRAGTDYLMLPARKPTLEIRFLKTGQLILQLLGYPS